MRANGVPNFPDPKPGEGFRFPASPAPAFAAAQAKCQKLLPNGGAPPPFHPQALAQLRQIAVCMRRHGVPDFPTPKELPRAAHQTRRPAATRSPITTECSSRSRPRSTSSHQRFRRRRLRAAAGSSRASDQNMEPSRTIGFVELLCRSQTEQEEGQQEQRGGRRDARVRTRAGLDRRVVAHLLVAKPAHVGPEVSGDTGLPP